MHAGNLLSSLLIAFSLSAGVPRHVFAQDPAPNEIQQWCESLSKSFVALKWKIKPCDGLDWKAAGHSVQGRPLVYAEFGDPNSKNTTLIFSMAHGDEITPLFLGIQLAHWMKENAKRFPKTHVIIAPLVNPDSYLRKPRTRVNAHGVDVNRNFLTRDWDTTAIRAWKTKFRSDPRRFPGEKPRSEPETYFQEDLIKKFQPQKLLSVHAPLNFIDYDGPTPLSLARFSKEYVHECLMLRKKLKAISSGYFPGSLGNYAGHELGIPTLTLELPSADPKKAEAYWKRFSTGIRTMIEFTVPDFASRKPIPTKG